MSPHEWLIILDILRTHLGSRPVYAFGSRVRGKVKQYSDLDLLIEDKPPVTNDSLALLNEKFSESDLPYKVDIVLESEISGEFKKLVHQHAVPIFP